MLFDTNNGTSAGYALGSIGPESFPILRRALTNGHERVRRGAVLGITARHDVARLAMPEILALRHDTNEWIPLIALLQIRTSLPKDESWLVAVEFLRDSRPRVQVGALRLLEDAATNAALAVPLVASFLTNLNSTLREHATNTFIALDPVAAAAHGVNTNQNQGGRVVP